MCYHVSTFDWIKALEREKPVSLNRVTDPDFSIPDRGSKRPRIPNPDPQH